MSDEIQLVEEITIEKTIENKLVKANVTDKVINELKEKAALAKIDGPDDRDGYKAVVDIRKEVKGWRVLAGKICKDGREDAVQIQKKWVAKEKEIVDQLKAIEDPLQKMEDEYEAERERKKTEEKNRLERQGAVRTADLIKLGAAFDGTNFTLEDVEYEYALIKESDDEVYNEIILPKYKAIYDRKEANRLAHAKKEADEKAAKDAEIKALADQKAELDRQQAELDKKKNEERVRVINMRAKQLRELGFEYSGDNSKLKHPGYTGEFVVGNMNIMDGESWHLNMQQVQIDLGVWQQKESDRIAKENEQKAEIERKRNLQATRFATLQAFDIVAASSNDFHLAEMDDDEWDELHQKYKEGFEKKAREKADKERADKQQAEELKKKAELEVAGDKEKWKDTLEHLSRTPIHEMRSSQYRVKMKAVRDFLETIK